MSKCQLCTHTPGYNQLEWGENHDLDINAYNTLR